jgi:hypothetical protein
MAFQQLYYTSCESGLLGYGGFQFNATTPGVGTAVLREVEMLTSYEAPRSMPSNPTPAEMATYPVSFSYLRDDQGNAVTARVVFAGTDYSGRPGNYFAHTLVTGSTADFGPVLPIELWNAPFWKTKPVSGTELPPLPGPPAKGALDRTIVGKLLANADRRAMPTLLSAVDQAMSGGRSVLLVGKDSRSNADWIAAICYLLGDDLARQLSFTTYSHRPTHSRYQIIGVVGELDQSVPASGFSIYDPDAGDLPDVPIHPLATLLADAGVNTAGTLWHQAASLFGQSARGFDEWYPLVAATALLQDVQLRTGDLGAIQDWLATAPDLPSSASQVLDKLIRSQSRSISDQRIADLQAVAVRMRSMPTAERLELMLVERAFARLKRGEAVGRAVKLSSRSAEAEAKRLAIAALHGIDDVTRVPALLSWTAGLGVLLPAAELHELGQRLVPYWNKTDLTTLLAGQPVILDGFIAGLAAEPQVAAGLFGKTDLIAYDDLHGHPALMEQWVLANRSGDFREGMEALRAIDGLRKQAGKGIDADLLDQLWPDRCPVSDLSRLLPLARRPSLRPWLADHLVAAFETNSADGQNKLLVALEKEPEAKKLLPPELGRSVASLARVRQLVDGAAIKVERGETDAKRVFKNLYAAYDQGDRRVRAELTREIPQLLRQTEYLDKALNGCPPEVRAAFFKMLQELITPKGIREDAVATVANVFIAMSSMDQRSKDWRDLNNAMAPVPDWNGGMRKKVRKQLNKSWAEAFDRWCEEQHGPRAMNKIRDLLFSRKDG